MEIESPRPTLPEDLMPIHYSPRASPRLQRCKKAGCKLCLRDRNYRYYCTSPEHPKTKRVKVGWVHTPDHPDGFKYHPAYEWFPKAKRLADMKVCPEGCWTINNGELGSQESQQLRNVEK